MSQELTDAVKRLTRVHIAGEKHRDVYPPQGYSGPTQEEDWQTILLFVADRLERPGVEWQPIETHPKAYRQCLLCTADGHVQEGTWNEFQQRFDDGGEGFEIDPAYWMPLPEPPKDSVTPAAT